MIKYKPEIVFNQFDLKEANLQREGTLQNKFLKQQGKVIICYFIA